MTKIHIIGLGLLGGSFAMAVKKAKPEWIITGHDNNPGHLKEAIAMGMVSEDKIIPDKDTDVVILATPVDSLYPILTQTLEQVGPHTLIMDFGSTKAKICQQMADHPRREQYLAVHPIAGTENSGPKAALEDLFDGKVLIICEMEKTNLHLKGLAYDIFEALNLKLRFMEPAEHDLHLAFVSHLSHVSSFVLGKTVLDKMEDEKNIFDMAGSGFASTVRLAKSSAEMWVPIMLENKTNMLAALDSYIQHLTTFRDMIAKDEAEGLFGEIREANKIRDILDLEK